MPITTYQNLIGGEWLPARSGKTFKNVNPADHSDIVGEFPSSGAEDVDLAVAAAKKAFATWRLVPAPKRAEILFRAGQLLRERKEQFAQDMTREMGKVLAETRGDVQEAIDEAFYVAGEGRRLFGKTTPSELQSKFAMSIRMPLGVVGMITPWNFPMAIPSWKLFPALVAGNACVIKPATDTPLSVYNLVNTLVEAGVPAGVLNIVCGGGGAVGNALVEHKDVRAISFTGSSEIGSHVAQRAAATFKPVSLEMGGKNAQIVLNDANLDLALDGALWGAFGTTGQRCTATSRILLQMGIAKQFIPKLVERAKALKVGNGIDESVQVGPQVNASQIETSTNYVEIAKSEGAKLECGGHALTDGPYANGTFFAPTIFSGVTREMRIAREEVFGPVLSILEFDTFEEAIEIANSIDYGLSSALYTKDLNKAFTAIRDLEAGITYINAPTIGAEVHLPFGGVKHTGNGHREGSEALDFFTTWKAVYVDYSDKLQRAQIDNAE
ncbi:aldehyde dehydrogenase family protein [Occallatibacter riparius]|uniref:Aldehyde dehydrogenase family protein n=1 Tax=Occallatibacter riparius TaxID=1002689 RepID=A0A9J7BTU6_9BACT|nr:aldehyde dehydrogenase family protein [Occallatibacter riparius]UWZ86315.1 aldehyde dehydrogenase family protein [Occallatibacter riparius]